MHSHIDPSVARSVRAASVAAGVIVVALAVAGAASAATLTVDKDRAQCPRADYTSIQGAVDAARRGDTVKVCPDVYAEQVTIARPLTVRAAGQPAAESGDCFAASVADPARQAIVDPAAGGFTTGFKLRANEIELRGLVVQGASVGIDAADAFSGYRIRQSLIQDNILFGIDLGSSGKLHSRVDHNCIRNNRWGLVSELDDDSTWPLPPFGTDPRPYARETFNARIEHNQTTGNTIGLAVSGPGRNGDVTIARNRSHRDGAGLDVGRLSDGVVAHNEITDTTETSGYGAIIIGPGSEGVLVAENRILGGTTVGIASGFSATDFEPAPTRRLVIRANEIRSMAVGLRLVAPYQLEDSWFIGNTISHSRGAGMNFSAFTGRNNTLERNTVTGNGNSGIFLGRGVTGFVIRNNRSDNNLRNGIGLGAGATGHWIEHNSMHGNGSEDPTMYFDANDPNLALNSWLGNACGTDNPPGAICGH